MTSSKFVIPTKKTAKKRDYFALYAAAVVLLIMLAVSGLIYRNVYSNNSNGNYASLPEVIVTNDGVAARLKVSIQVKKEDLDWLSEHQDSIHGQFRQLMSQRDLASLRTAEGIEAAQSEISSDLNRALKTDKIEGIFFTELLIQDQS
jgi:flagellar basal body-associated protein FliL